MIAIPRFGLVLALGMTGYQAVGRAQTAVTPPAFVAQTRQPGARNELRLRTSSEPAVAVFDPDVSAIAAGAILADSPEASVTAPSARAVTPPAVGQVDAQILDREVAARFKSVDHCRVDVARRKRMLPSQVKVDTITLRWTILKKGEVAAMDVIGTTPVDPAVLECVTREARRWRFTPPSGGDLRLERALVFRLLPSATPRP
jgi:hypothetical protein